MAGDSMRRGLSVDPRGGDIGQILERQFGKL
jgi:hypothetical protein